jgi:uncharacterized protein (TIGR03083 family)
LTATVEGLDPRQLAEPAYPAGWTIADVLSHLGSGAVIFRRRVDDIVAGVQSPPGFAQLVWDEWDAKSPRAKAADFLSADRALVDRLGSLSDDERAGFEFTMGPITLDFAGFIGMRLNEHALHTWDIEVALDPGATLAPDAAELVIDNLQMIARFAGKPTGTEHAVTVRTSMPERNFVIVVSTDAVSLEQAGPVGEPDLWVPAEAFIRLVYGRLDPDHTPATLGSADLDQLRRVFSGL